MREYKPDLSKWGISRNAYCELKAFCRQYDEKRREADDLLTVKSQKLTGTPGGGGISDPTARAALKRERLMRDCEMIERAANTAAGGRYSQALILNCCRDRALVDIDPAVLPSSNRSDFFNARRHFFWLLYQYRNEQ